MTVISLTRDEIQACYDFACEAVEGDFQQGLQFGHGNAGRAKNERIADKILGKMGEYIFKKTLESASEDIEVELNFEHFEGHDHLDDGDAKIYVNGIEAEFDIDVKATSHFSQWLLVEETKYYTDTIYPLVKFSQDVPSNPKLRSNPSQVLNGMKISGEVVGWMRGTEFAAENPETMYFRYNQGERPYREKYIPNDFRERTRDGCLNEINRYYNNTVNHAQNNGYPAPTLHLGVVLEANVNYGMPVKGLRSVQQLIELVEQ